MKVIRDIYNLNEQSCGCVLTIGNFDGMHRGHQELMIRLIHEGRRRNIPVVVILFEPQPLELFTGNNAPARLTLLREKLQYLKNIGIDTVLCIRFNKNFASYLAQHFIMEILVAKLKVKFLAIGDDFRFGSGRQGDFILLRKFSLKFGFEVISTQTLCENGQRISSTAIRKALAEDDFKTAHILLGYPFSISGRVVHGKAIGRTLGFPTANIPLKRIVTPVHGVFAVEVLGIGNGSFKGVANIGLRPTLKSLHMQLEVHLLDMNIDIYGYHIKVILIKKIRNERFFSSLEALKEQIKKDVIQTRQFFSI